MSRFFTEIETVLVIDDDEATQRALKKIITSCGYEVVVASSWAGALVEFASNPIDVVFCDLRFPGDISGDQILQLVQLHYPDVKVVLMSCVMTDEVGDDLLANGASYCLQKPLYKDECQEILLHLGEQQFFQPGENIGFSGSLNQDR